MIGSEYLDYLQRTGSFAVSGASVPLEASTHAPPENRRLFTIKGVGRLEKQAIREKERLELATEALLIGLYGYKVPLAFMCRGDSRSVSICLGTWEPSKAQTSNSSSMAKKLALRQEVIASLLATIYPAVDLEESPVDSPTGALSGLVVGIPSVKPPNPLDGALPLDRLVRALAGKEWSSLVLAQPVDESLTNELRQGAIAALSSAQSSSDNPGESRRSDGLSDYYRELLGVLVNNLTSGLAAGVWRTGVYLLGDTESYFRLASAWRSIFEGDESLPEPIAVCDSAAVNRLAMDWALPDTSGASGPGRYRHSVQFQTLLTSAQLAAYVHLPQLETNGFSINVVPDFDAVPPSVAADTALDLGHVVHRTRLTSAEYAVSPEAFTRHTFVTGVTGSGKTTTISYLLRQAAASGTPFLVIEPAKREYRALLDDPALKNQIQIFTLGNESVAPLRLNPFEALPGTPVGVHLDLLRSVFNAGFGLWSVLPAVLEQCLHAVYEDRGWDIATNGNSRLDEDSDVADAFPTLADLAAKADELTRTLHYDAETRGNIRATLLTRINSLRSGSKGRMLDVQRSFPMNLLLERPTVLELEGIGDDDDKAFLMGLLFVRLVEFRRARGAARRLEHLLVIEEAHRLLAAVAAPRGEQEANSRGKAVDTFANLIAEIRAYGQGLIIADQSPGSVSPAVMKNTNLKIAHRVVASDDRASLADAMAMTERQSRALAVLTRGQAAVFGDGDDAPVLVQVPAPSDNDKATQFWPDDARVAEYMGASQPLLKDQTLFLPFQVSSVRKAAGHIIEDPKFQHTVAHMVLSTIENVDALDRLWPGLLDVVQAKRPPQIDERELLRWVLIGASEWFSHRRGAQAQWKYAQTKEFANKLRQMLLAKLSNESSEPVRTEFHQYASTLHSRDYSPFPACEQVCQQQPPVCLYRHAVADLIAEGTHAADWNLADKDDTAGRDGEHSPRWGACLRAGYDLIEFPTVEWPEDMQRAGADAARRASLCFAQQMLAADALKPPSKARQITDLLLTEVRR